jgi:hypothetical protein
MSAVFKTGPITFDAAEDIEKFRLVSVAAEGAKHADGTAAVFGAVVTGANANPPARTNDNVLHIGKPGNVAVHVTPAVVPVETEGTFAPGAPVYAAADGKAAATGAVFVGTAVRASGDGKVKVLLATPTAPVAAGTGE